MVTDVGKIENVRWVVHYPRPLPVGWRRWKQRKRKVPRKKQKQMESCLAQRHWNAGVRWMGWWEYRINTTAPHR